ncbi:MAG: hypothetical protein ABF260_10525 [Flavobacteriaceae bacterium]|jgi:hypothetical protein|tara:strand:+ start:562 stop:864 length:303 start_codon:yes stop_codon:yes gene_type:complete
MSKFIFSYLFSFILLASIVAPTYISFSDLQAEATEIVDLGEEEENKGNESVKDLEVKIYYSTTNESLFVSLEKKKRMSFYSKNYTSYYKKLSSPPPELKS